MKSVKQNEMGEIKIVHDPNEMPKAAKALIEEDKAKKKRESEKREAIEEKGRNAELLQKQRDLRVETLSFLRIKFELQHMISQWKSGDIKVQWSGMPCPKDILGVNIELNQHNLKICMMEINRIENYLKNNKFTKKQIEAIKFEGKFLPRKDED